MYGLWYSVKENFSFSRKEFMQVFWTSLAFSFIVSFRKWGTGDNVDVTSGMLNWAIAIILVLAAMLIHVSAQKIVAIKLGYKATYSYWINGILFCLVLVFVSRGYATFILPGAIAIDHVSKLRLGKFRYGINTKDIARVALAGPLVHVILVMIIGMFFFWSGRSDLIFSFILLNLMLAVFSILPIPKLTVPTKMDSGTDGLGIIYFSRTIYVLSASTIILYAFLVYTSVTNLGLGWLFAVAFFLAAIFATIYSISLEQRN